MFKKMDNMSGNANWFNQDAEIEEKEIPKVNDKPIPEINHNLIREFIDQVEKNYNSKPDKYIGDVLVHLNTIEKLFKL